MIEIRFLRPPVRLPIEPRPGLSLPVDGNGVAPFDGVEGACPFTGLGVGGDGLDGASSDFGGGVTGRGVPTDRSSGLVGSG